MKKNCLLIGITIFISTLLPSGIWAKSQTIDFPVIGFTSVITEPTTFSMEWNPDWFSRGATSYNHGIARIAAILATSAYCDIDNENHTDVLSADYRQLGIKQKNIEYHYDIDYTDQLWGNDQCAFSFAHTEIQTEQGLKNLVFIVVRGTPLNANEWISNLKISSTDKPHLLHEGFLKASQQIITAFYAYLLEQQLSIHDCFFLVTGHSRGAAVSNMLGSLLIENRLFNKDNLFVYTFASPNVTTDTQAGSEKYNFIWNIVNAEDIVPTVPLSRDQWQYRKYGHTLTFLNAWNCDSNYYQQEVLPRVSSYFKKTHQRDYSPFKLGPFVPIQITRFLSSINSTVEQYNSGVFGLKNKAQKILWKVFPAKKEKVENTTLSEHLEQSKLEDEQTTSDEQSALVNWLDNLTNGLIDYLMKAANDMHTPETYLSHLLALEEKDLYSSAETNELIISGATECAVFSKSGDLLMRVRDSHVEYSSISLPIAGFQVNNSTFCIGYPATEDYDIVLYRSSIIPTPVSVRIEHYTADGKLKSVGEKNKTYLRKGMAKFFSAGKSTTSTDTISYEKIKGKSAKDFISRGQLSRLWKMHLGLETSMDSDWAFTGGFNLGTQALYGGALFSHNMHQLGNAFQITSGIGTEQNLWSRIMINFEVGNHFVQAFADPDNPEDDSGSFNFVPVTRVYVSYKPRKRFEFFTGLRFDFHITDFNDTAFDKDIRDTNLWSIDFSDRVEAYPTVIFGLKF